MRKDGRKNDETRKIRITDNYIKSAEGSVLIESGDTKVICTASVEEGVPAFLKNSGRGWVTAEYGMIPRATHTRTQRDSAKGKINGRTQEIQRLIGRVLRSVVDMNKLGERTVWIDCDVIQADGGTRTASITGSFMALVLALKELKKRKIIEAVPVKNFVGAISVGIVEGEMVVDMDYSEDSCAEVDMNVAMTDDGDFIEIQGTAEKTPFSLKKMNALIDLAKKSIMKIIKTQKSLLKL